jgi:hypothetical protein
MLLRVLDIEAGAHPRKLAATRSQQDRASYTGNEQFPDVQMLFSGFQSYCKNTGNSARIANIPGLISSTCGTMLDWFAQSTRSRHQIQAFKSLPKPPKSLMPSPTFFMGILAILLFLKPVNDATSNKIGNFGGEPRTELCRSISLEKSQTKTIRLFGASAFVVLRSFPTQCKANVR